MFCKHCGSQIADGTKFCPACGKPTGATATPNTSSSPNAVPKTPRDFTSNSGSPFKKSFNIGNYIVWAGCIIASISLFLNFASASISVFGVSASESVKLSDEPGMVVMFLVLFVLVAVLNFFKLHIGNIIGSVISLGLTVAILSIISDELGAFRSMVEYGMGRNLLVLGTVVMLGGSIAGFILNQKAKKAA